MDQTGTHKMGDCYGTTGASDSDGNELFIQQLGFKARGVSWNYA